MELPDEDAWKMPRQIACLNKAMCGLREPPLIWQRVVRDTASVHLHRRNVCIIIRRGESDSGGPR